MRFAWTFPHGHWLCLVFSLSYSVAIHARAADEFDQPPISYREHAPENRVSRLLTALEQGKLKLDHDETRGYLPALLAALEIPVESQMLVFSKTSLQLRRITPRAPRAIYFNDDVYLGYCQNGDVLEISAADPQLGAVFYTLDQQPREQPRLERQVDGCLICHASSRTENIPGHVVRSLFVDLAGQPIFSAGSQSVDHTTPIDKRWGGWYVTGKHGDQKHLGNLAVPRNTSPRDIDNAPGQNVLKLDDRFDVDHYLSPHSDIVALMVFEHQTLVHNRITQANFAARQAIHYEQAFNQAVGDLPNSRLESTTRRIQNAGDDLVEALLLVDEAPLSAPFSGTSGFAEKFAQQGPRDAQNRSLRDLDITRRLFKYPCSYLIYSPAFEGLPSETKNYVWRQLWEILSADSPPEKFGHLTTADRKAILEILAATKSGLPDYWQVAEQPVEAPAP